MSWRKFRYSAHTGTGIHAPEPYGPKTGWSSAAVEYFFIFREINLNSTRERKAAQLEVDLLKTLKHPNIVGYHDSFDNSDGNLMIVMAFCEGGDLNRYLRQKQDFLDEQNLVEWLVQICMALQVPYFLLKLKMSFVRWLPLIFSVSSFKKYSPSWFENSKYFPDFIAYYQAWWPWDRACSRFCSRLGNNCYRDPILYEPRIISKYPIWKRIGCMGPWMLHIWNDDKETCIQRQVITYYVIITSSLRIVFTETRI